MVSFITHIHTKLHRRFALTRRVEVLARELSAMLPDNVSVLDVGCGSGEISREIIRRRSNVTLDGIDLVIRPDCAIPVKPYDGQTFPVADKSYDFVILVDVLHHTPDPMILLREAERVARRGIIVKDHNCNSQVRRLIMTITDTLGNWQYKVPLLFNFWPTRRWQEAWSELGLVQEAYISDFGLYPPIRGCIFARDMDFIARLRPAA
ncbi:MAG: class I SAM-dependent methyltransferase [Bdellovibrionota bacterium]